MSKTYPEFDWEGVKAKIHSTLEEILRPAVDAAIRRRQESAKTERADIDTDAAARGMERSSYVTNVKSRAEADAQDDISGLEQNYSEQLAKSLQSMLKDAYDTYAQEKYRQQQLDLEKQKLAQSNAQFEKSLKLQYAKMKQSSQQSGTAAANNYSDTETKSTFDNTNGKTGYTYEDYVNYVDGMSADERFNLFNSTDMYWKVMRSQIIHDIGRKKYSQIAIGYLDDDWLSKLGGAQPNYLAGNDWFSYNSIL